MFKAGSPENGADTVNNEAAGAAEPVPMAALPVPRRRGGPKEAHGLLPRWAWAGVPKGDLTPNIPHGYLWAQNFKLINTVDLPSFVLL